MKIIKNDNEIVYYDANNNLLKDGDQVFMDGRVRTVYLSEDGQLGIDATNPRWIKLGRADICEYGIYPFTEDDEPIKVIDSYVIPDGTIYLYQVYWEAEKVFVSIDEGKPEWCPITDDGEGFYFGFWFIPFSDEIRRSI